MTNSKTRLSGSARVTDVKEQAVKPRLCVLIVVLLLLCPFGYVWAEPISSASFPQEEMKDLTGEHTSVLFKTNSPFLQELLRILGDQFEKVRFQFEAADVLKKEAGRYLIGTGCMPHACGTAMNFDSMIIIDTKTEEVWVSWTHTTSGLVSIHLRASRELRYKENEQDRLIFNFLYAWLEDLNKIKETKIAWPFQEFPQSVSNFDYTPLGTTRLQTPELPSKSLPPDLKSDPLPQEAQSVEESEASSDASPTDSRFLGTNDQQSPATTRESESSAEALFAYISSVYVLVLCLSLLSWLLSYIFNRSPKINRISCGYKWGFFIATLGFFEVIFSFWLVLHNTPLLSEDLLFYRALLLFFSSVSVFRQTRWGWVLHTVVSLNPAWLIINVFYGYTRWREMKPGFGLQEIRKKLKIILVKDVFGKDLMKSNIWKGVTRTISVTNLFWCLFWLFKYVTDSWDQEENFYFGISLPIVSVVSWIAVVWVWRGFIPVPMVDQCKENEKLLKRIDESAIGSSDDETSDTDGNTEEPHDLESRAKRYHDQIDAQIESSYNFLQGRFGGDNTENSAKRYSLKTISVFAVHIATLIAIKRGYPQLHRSTLNGFTHTLSFRTPNTMPNIEPPKNMFVSYCSDEESFMHTQTETFEQQGVEPLVRNLLQHLGGKDIDYKSLFDHLEYTARQIRGTYLPFLTR